MLYATVKETNHAQLGSKIPVRLWLKNQTELALPTCEPQVIGIILAIRETMLGMFGQPHKAVTSAALNRSAMRSLLPPAL